MSKKETSIAVVDFNVPAMIPGRDDNPENGIPEDILLKYLHGYCKKWVYQPERNTYNHWQVRASLIKKRFVGMASVACRDFFRKELGDDDWSGHGTRWFSATCGDTALADDFLYVLKADTRIGEPRRWDNVKKTKFVQKRYQGDVKLHEWQERLIDTLDADFTDINDRNIHMVEDNGGEGKSFLKGYLALTDDNVIILPSSLSSGNDMMQYLCSNSQVKEGGHYKILMDVPRATSGKHWWTLAQGLEAIKQGFLYDTRYTCKTKTIEVPTMCCFMNKKPPDGVMTSDVFKYFVKYPPTEEDAYQNPQHMEVEEAEAEDNEAA